MKTITGKTALVTGASRGVGELICYALAKKQATVVGVARSKEGLDKVYSNIEALGGCGFGIPFDIGNTQSLSDLVQRVEQVAGSVDILINNAAIEKYQPFQNYSSQDLQRILSTNLMAAMELTRLLLPQMIQKGSGHVVNIASLAGKKGSPYNSVYSASKAGLLMWTDSLRQELLGTGVGISVLCPGYISQCGMSVDTGVPIPKLAGTSTPDDLAVAVINAIERNKAELIVNDNFISEALTKLLFAIGEFSPQSLDTVYQWLGVTRLNQKRVEHQLQITNLVGELQ